MSAFPAYFAHATAAARYAAFRPDVHPEFASRIATVTGPRRCAVDAGTGTGQSARALRGVAGAVMAVDPAADMLAAAAPLPGVHYVRARAEAVPVATGAADLVVAALAFHWFDPAAFLAEAGRVLGGDGWLVVYDSWFLAEMDGAPGFREWFTGTHLERFPTPPRSRVRLDAELAAAHGFALEHNDAFRHDVALGQPALVGYLLTQTNVIAAVEHGDRTVAEIAALLTADTTGFYAGRDVAGLGFGGRIAYLRPTASRPGG